MPLYEYECDACGHRFEVIQKFSDPPLDDVPEVRRRACASCSRRRRFSSRAAAGTSPTTRRRISRRQGRAASRKESDGVERDRRTKADKRQDEKRRRQGRDSEERRTQESTPAGDIELVQHDRATPSVDTVGDRSAASRTALSAFRPARRVRATRGTPRTCPRGRAAAARSRPPLSGSPACCRCRGGRP